MKAMAHAFEMAGADLRTRLESAVKEAVKQFPHDRKKAGEAFYEIVRTDKTLYNYYVVPLLIEDTKNLFNEIIDSPNDGGEGAMAIVPTGQMNGALPAVAPTPARAAGGGHAPPAAEGGHSEGAPAGSRSVHVADNLNITETRASAGGEGHRETASDGQFGADLPAKPTPRPSTITPAALRNLADRFADREFGTVIVNGQQWWKELPGDLAAGSERRIKHGRQILKEGRFLDFVSRAAEDLRKPVGEQLSDEDFANAVEYAELANAVA